MKKNIKLIILTAIFGLAFTLTACNFSANNSEKNKKKTTTTNTPTTTPSGNTPDNPDIELEAIDMPLTLQAITDGKIILSGRDAFEEIRIQRNDGLITAAADNIPVKAGDKILFYGSKYNYKESGATNLTIDCTADCYVYGNVMSLIYFTDFAGKTTLTDNYALQKLFLNNTHIKNHESLDIILPATTLSEGCYKKMFYGCTGLTRAPELPAATLTKECYNSMFLGCKNLNSIKCLATNILAADCTQNWVANVNKTGTFLCAQENSFWFYKDIASGIPRGWISDPPVASVDAKELPLTLEAIEDGAIAIINFDKFDHLQYSKNNGDKTDVTGNIPVLAGDKVCFFAEGPKFASLLRINCFGDCYVYGNIMSLIHPENFKNLTEITTEKCFYNLFSNNTEDTHLKNCAIDLVLPATTLSKECYSGMFEYCSGLTVAPELPAETLAESCYSAMFLNCNGLTVAPELPATTLAPACYYRMFEKCKGLTIAPEVLPAETLAEPLEIQTNSGNDFEGCYQNMFYNCENLINAPVLPAISLQERCYSAMFAMCKNLIVAPELPATTLAKECYNSMFNFCEKLTMPPELGAENLAVSCYFNMFANCTALICAPAILPAIELEESCYANMFSGCTALTYAPVIKAEKMALKSCERMFLDCKALTTAPELLAEELAQSCYTYMFQNCEGLKVAPMLRAKVLQPNCYSHMFEGCNNIHIIQCLAQSGTNNSQFLYYGLSGIGLLICTNTGNFSTDYNQGYFGGWKRVKEIPLTLEAKNDGEIKITNPDAFNDLEYIKNYGTSIYVTSTGTVSISVSAGDIIWFFAKGHKTDSSNSLQINCTEDCYVYGDLMSLDNYSDIINFPNNDNIYVGEFEKLFYNNQQNVPNTHIKNHPSKKIILSAKTLNKSCYKSMFEGCTELTEAPELPATTLAGNCYEAMFKNCTGLTSAPELPATTLEWGCYIDMFNRCKGLTSAPDLTKAQSLAPYCYHAMFFDCDGLTTAPELPLKNLEQHCYDAMFSSCDGLISAPELLATNLADACYQYMFALCTSLKIAPELPASNLVTNCYSFMFNGCTSLKYIKCLATNGYTYNGTYTKNWVQNVPTGGTFVRASDSNWNANTVGFDAIPTGWTIIDATDN